MRLILRLEDEQKSGVNLSDIIESSPLNHIILERSVERGIIVKPKACARNREQLIFLGLYITDVEDKVNNRRLLPFTMGTALLFAQSVSNADVPCKIGLSIYGVGHVSADLNNDGNSHVPTIASSSSRIGFQGRIDLDDDLRIIAQYENGLDLTARGKNDGNGGTSSDARLFTLFRDSFAGFHHKYFGELVAGRIAALNQYVYDYNLFANQLGDLGNLWGNHGLFPRINGAIQYTSPTFSDFSLRGIVAPGAGEGNKDIYIFTAHYKRRRGFVKFAYLNQGQTNEKAADHQAFAITTRYIFRNGKYSLGGGYQQEFNASGIDGNDFNSVTLGGSGRLGANKFKAQFGWMGNGLMTNSGAVTWAIGYDYNFRKDTTIYFAYSGVSNENTATVSANNYGHGQAISFNPGKDPWSISIGLVYKFDMNILP